MIKRLLCLIGIHSWDVWAETYDRYLHRECEYCHREERRPRYTSGQARWRRVW